jgi:hypothetical protein
VTAQVRGPCHLASKILITALFLLNKTFFYIIQLIKIELAHYTDALAAIIHIILIF